MPLQAVAALATLVGFAPHGNAVDLQLDRGQARIVWLSPSTFRFSSPAAPAATAAAPVEVEIRDTPDALVMRSKFLEVSIAKRGVLLRIRKRDGTELLSESGNGDWSVFRRGLAENGPVPISPTREPSLRQAPPGSRFYGLGPSTAPDFDLSGTHTTETPFLYCTAGFGEWHPQPGTYRFDFQAGGRYAIDAPARDFYFYYGPTLKQVLEEHNRVRGTAPLWAAAHDRFGSWDTLAAALPRILHGAISGMIAPTFDLKPYDGAPDELRTRARQLGSLVAELSPGRAGVSGFRKQLESFFATYAVEQQEKGYPLWHPLPFQFPDDPECARHADEFLLGDEMLVAPIVAPGNARRVYLPQGVWTNLETDEVLQGRQTISVTTASLPVFARNGAVVPLDSPAGMALHYFPKLGAEFFLLDNAGAQWTQLHAAPAGDDLWLEIESRSPRDYQWVVHHVARPAAVVSENAKFSEARPGALADRTWTYDPAPHQLQIRIRVARDEDRVVSVTFPAANARE